MSAYDSNARRRSILPQPGKSARRALALAASVGAIGLSTLWACSNSDSTGGNGGSSTGSFSGNSGNGGTGSSGNSGSSSTGNSGNTGNTGNSGNGGTGSSGNSTTGSTGGTGSSGNSGNGGTGSTGTTGSAGATGSGTGSTGTTGSAMTGTTGTTGSSGTTTGSASGGGVDAGSMCKNTDKSTINIDSSGVACNNQWNITGAWYCFADTAGSAATSSCPGGTAGTGTIPYVASSSAMCLSGTTVAQMPSATAYGAAIGLELNHPNLDAGAKMPFNAKAQNIIGFAITLSGSSGGANLNINFPGNSNATSSSGENPGVAVPGVASGSSPITYNVLFQDAIMSDNTATPIPKIVDATNVTDVQVKIDVDDTAHAYNFCITKIVPITAAPTEPAAGTAYGPTFTEGKQIVLSGLGPYGVQNDPFNVGNTDSMSMQVTYGSGQVGFTAKPTFGSTGNTPGAFPSVVYGWVHGGNFVGGQDTGGYNGGKTIGQLNAVTSSWAFSPGSGNWDAAYDCWFGGNSNSINPGSELMVWVNHANVNPIGGQNTAVTVANSSNGPWTVSTGTNGTGQPVVSYVTTAGTNSVSNFAVLPFFKEAASSGRASLSSGSFFLGCQTGFELYGAGTFTTTSFSMTAN
jgi:hypothetical protein